MNLSAGKKAAAMTNLTMSLYRTFEPLMMKFSKLFEWGLSCFIVIILLVYDRYIQSKRLEYQKITSGLLHHKCTIAIP